MTSPWLDWRRKGLGGSDIAAILGVSKWSSALTVWADKTGKVERELLDAKEHIEWGNRLEKPIIEAYWERTQRLPMGTRLYMSDNCSVHEEDHFGDLQVCYDSTEHPWALATPDGFVDEYKPLPWEDHADERFRGHGILEVKTTNAFNKSDWADGPPDYYECQAQHYLLVTGLEWCSFAVLIGGQELRIFDMTRKPMLIEQIIEVGSYFWEKNVMGDTPPRATGIEAEGKVFKSIFPKETSHHLRLPDDAGMQLEVIRQVDAALKPHEAKVKELKQRKEAARNNLRMMMGEASTAEAPDGTTMTYRTVNRKGYVVQPSASRQLRIKRVRASQS